MPWLWLLKHQEKALKKKSLPRLVAPSGSLDVENRTGSWVVGVDMSVVAQAILWEEPHATLVIL